MKRDFDAWFVAEYDALVEMARAIHRDNRDLVHHTYLRCVRAIERGSTIKNFQAYFNRAMFIVRCDDFGRLYFRGDYPKKDLVSTSNVETKIREDEALLLARHLSWFDRTVLELYLDGWSMAEIARESGISVDVLYKSISNSKKALRNVVGIRSN